jgi:hypothetical protein
MDRKSKWNLNESYFLLIKPFLEDQYFREKYPASQWILLGYKQHLQLLHVNET